MSDLTQWRVKEEHIEPPEWPGKELTACYFNDGSMSIEGENPLKEYLKTDTPMLVQQ